MTRAHWLNDNLSDRDLQILLVPHQEGLLTLMDVRSGLPIWRVQASPLTGIGYGGNGITFSVIAARLIADLYLGRPNADASVFAFDRQVSSLSGFRP